MPQSNSISVYALAALILTLAVANAFGWAVLFAHAIPALLVLVVCAFCSEIIAANLAIELERTAKAKRFDKIWGIALLAVVFGAVNIAGTHNAWLQAEELVLGDERKAALIKVESDLERARGTLKIIDDTIDAIPQPDPNSITSRQQAATEFYRIRMTVLTPRRDAAVAELKALPTAPPPIQLVDDDAALVLFGLLEVVKFVGFWSLSAGGFLWAQLMFWRPRNAPITGAKAAATLRAIRTAKERNAPT